MNAVCNHWTGLDYWTPSEISTETITLYDIEYSLQLTIQYSQIISLLIYRFKMSEQQLRIILYLLYLSKSFSLKSNN